jgi:Amt family ammonium transporter
MTLSRARVGLPPRGLDPSAARGLDPSAERGRHLSAALRGLAVLLLGALALAGALAGLPAEALAAEKPKLDSGDTAWMLTATAIVLMMTIPGLALFYGGMVRKKNVLTIVMQVFATACIGTIVWFVVGYSIAFGGEGAYWGGLSKAFLAGVGKEDLSGTIPETVFMTFQMTFAIITPALIVGAFADRVKFSALVVFMTLWIVVVYAPITHWVWGDKGWILALGALDFAGGTVVHINSGVAGLAAAIVIGKRVGYRKEDMSPHNLVLSMIGAALLWVGWFGFNAGSALSAGTGAGMAMAVTQIASAAAALAWMFAEWLQRGKPTVLGILSGAIAGLVAITPASGFVDPKGALFIGLIGGVVCYWASTSLKKMLGYDDALDVFGIHGVGGIVGAILTGVFAVKAIGGTAGALEGNVSQILTQVYGILGTIVWSGAVTVVLLVVIKMTIGLRVSDEEERDSLDLRLHGESVH